MTQQQCTTPGDLTEYHAFLASKKKTVQKIGFHANLHELNANLWRWQSLIVQWSLGLGRSAIFADCGLGKTLMQLSWADAVHRHASRPVLILCPLAVAWQTKREAERFGIRCPVQIIESREDVADDAAICICNYEKLHLLDCSVFSGVVLDESSVLKNYTGKTKQMLIEQFRTTQFKLCCTATPAPNDYLELGNHAEFLGIMPSNQMISNWFINDSMKSGGYKLLAHGEADFWRWMSEWAICISNPADLGDEFADVRYTLPKLEIVERYLEVAAIPEGYLINPGTKVSATNVHAEKRLSLTERCKAVADLARSNNKPWVLWCGTDYEANEILKQLGVKGDGSDSLGGVVEVRGSHSVEVKESRLKDFAEGRARVIITKPSIGGFGLNWQHCDQMTWFASFSYEDFYQAIRRMLRFGQMSPVVRVHLIASENEESVVRSTKEKELQHLEMKSGMSERMKDLTRTAIGLGGGGRRDLKKYESRVNAAIPSWLASH